MVTISLCMIVKNEAKVLERCLKSVAGAVDEIILVDTGSTDDTKQIAAQFTNKIFDFQWIDDFSAARNFAFSKATMDYQFWLDADDVMTDDQRERLLDLKNTLPPETDVVTMLYHIGFNPQGQPTLVSMRERLLRRQAGFRWEGAVHECITMSGSVFHSDIYLIHRREHEDSDRNLRIYQRKLDAGAPFSPRESYYFARELMDHMHFADAADWFSRFLDDEGGWVEDNISACLALGYCYGQLGQQTLRQRALVRSFWYGLPRAELLCQLGYDAKAQNDYRGAIYWFESATQAPIPQNQAFDRPDHRGYIPHLELCVCYDKLGDFEKAALHNERAGEFKPENEIVAQNRRYFEQIF